jgi:predicted ester cyclase
LFRQFPKSLFTAQIAREIARDEEFVKKLLFNLRKKGFVAAIRKNSKGIPFSRRIRWRISNKAYQAYKQHQ